MWTSMFRREIRVTKEVNPNKIGKQEINYMNFTNDGDFNQKAHWQTTKSVLII